MGKRLDETVQKAGKVAEQVRTHGPRMVRAAKVGATLGAQVVAAGGWKPFIASRVPAILENLEALLDGRLRLVSGEAPGEASAPRAEGVTVRVVKPTPSKAASGKATPNKTPRPGR